MQNLTPLHDRVFVRPATAAEVSAGGIIIPDIAQEKPLQGTIIAAGPGKRNDRDEIVPLQVKVGDHILYGQYSGVKVEFEGESLIMMCERDIYGIIH